MGSSTSASILGIVQQGEIKGIDDVSVIEWVVDVGIMIMVPRVGHESEKKDDDEESNGCDCLIFLGPLPPPSESAKPRVRHYFFIGCPRGEGACGSYPRVESVNLFS